MHRWVRGLAAIVVAGVTAGVLAGCDATGSAVVSRVIDGDTIDVTKDGREQRVRLLNVDTPETKDPDVDVQCLGPEASAFLAQLLPPGTEVDLALDDEHLDQYGRLLAGAYLPDGRLANAELARAGLGVPMTVGGNDRFAAEVTAAQQEAVTARRGFYDPAIACTPPGQVQAAEAAMATTSTPTTTPEGYEQAAGSAAAVIATATVLQSKFTPSPRAVAFKAAALLPELSRRAGGVLRSAQNRHDAMVRAAAVARTPPPNPDPPAAPTVRKPKPKPTPTSGGGTADRPRSDRSASTPTRSSGGSAPSAGRSTGTSGSGAGIPGRRNKYSAPKRCYAPGGKTWKPC